MSARVLVVDDIFPNVKLLETKLTAEYFDVVTAMNGPDALAICEQGLADIVLLDVMMPGMDGFEVCRRIKNAPLTAHLPVVMVTALDQPSDRLKGLDAGADDFLTKPLDDTALMACGRSRRDRAQCQAPPRRRPRELLRAPRDRARAVPPGRGRARPAPGPDQGR